MRLHKKVKLRKTSSWDNPLLKKEVSEWVIRFVANRGSLIQDSKKRIFNAYKKMDKKEFISFLVKEYGVGGFGSKPDKDNVVYDCDFSSKGFKVAYVENNEYYKGEISWNTVAKYIGDLIDKNEYYKKGSVLRKKSVRKKATLNKKIKLKPIATLQSGTNKLTIVDEENEDGYTGQWNNNFPYLPVKKKVDIIDNVDDLKILCNAMKNLKAFSFDTETNTLDVLSDNPNFRCSDITISWGENNNYDIILGHIRDEDIDRNIDLDIAVKYLKPIFEKEDILIVGANLKFDIHVMNRLGIHIKTNKLFDVVLASWICNENTKNGLKENSSEYMGISQTKFKETTDSIPNDIKKQFGYKANSKVNDFGLVLIDEGYDYCTDDSFYTWCLYLGFRDLIVQENMDKIYYKRMIPFMQVLCNMEERGVSVDVEKLVQMQKDMTEDMERLTYDIYELSGVEFNIGSSQQKAEILFGYKKPDVLMQKGKINKSIQNIIDRYKSKEIDKIEFATLLEKNGAYLKNNNIYKRSNRNDEVLAHSFNFPVIAETKGGSPSTDKNTLLQLSKCHYKNKRKQQGIEVVKKMLEYSKLDKLKGTFADGLLEKIKIYSDGKVHTNYNQIGTDSGRISSSNPNLQQLPNADEDDKYQIRDVFIGSPYVKSLDTGNLYDSFEEFEREEPNSKYEEKRKKLIAIDYHNLEMVCLCYFSKDHNLTDMFANDDDAHGSTAVNMFNLDCTPVECKKKYPHLRQAAKTINFMLMYGGGANTLYESLKYNPYDPLDLGSNEYLEKYNCNNGVEVAQVFIDRYFKSYSGVAKFIKDQHRYAHKYGYVWTISGRKRRLPDINSSNREWSAKSERLSVNASIQGTAGDITSSAQIRVEDEQELKDYLCYMLMQVHDEIVLECPEEYLDYSIKTIKHDMEHPFGESEKAQVPFLRADPGYGNSYQEAK